MVSRNRETHLNCNRKTSLSLKNPTCVKNKIGIITLFCAKNNFFSNILQIFSAERVKCNEYYIGTRLMNVLMAHLCNSLLSGLRVCVFFMNPNKVLRRLLVVVSVFVSFVIVERRAASM